MNARHVLFAAICGLAVCGESSAALDGEAKKPYQLTVVLHVAENRLLTDVFRDRVARELGDGLQAALGDLAEVKVVREHPRLADVLGKGLQRSLDTWNDRSNVKTHFVLLDFSGVHYEIQARQYDGLSGTATPVVRRDRTQDREFVARTAALLVERDFGIVATFAAWPRGKKPQKVQLELKGGGLDVAMNRWVQKGDVFAVVQIPAGNGIGRTVPDAIVQIEATPREGDPTCEGNLFWRREPPGGAGVAGYRCVKLGATRGPLQVRLVQINPKDGSPGELPSPAPTLLVRHRGFVGEDDRLEVRTDPKVHGFYDTGKSGPFDRVAFVSVKFDGAIRAEIPLPLLDDQPVIIPVTLLEDDTTLAEIAKRTWKLGVVESYAVQSTVFTELQELSAKKDTPRAKLIETAKEAAKRSAADLQRLRAERDEVFDPKALTDADRRDLAQADQRLKAIQDGEQELKRYFKAQEDIDKEEKSPEQRRRLEQIERGKLLEKDGELGKAIDAYTAALKDGFKSEELEKRVQQLRELWEPKDDKHRAARAFIYDVWPTLDTSALQARMPEAHEALAKCREVGDFVGPQKLYKGIQLHAARLLKEAEGLREVNEEDAKQLKLIREIGASLAKLEAEIKAYLDKAPK